MAELVQPNPKPPQIRLARNPSGKFAKGHSGNPGGRPQTKLISQALREAMDPEAIAAIVLRQIQSAKRDADKLAAAKEVMDRTEGKATQAIRVTGEVDPNTLAKLTELAELLK